MNEILLIFYNLFVGSVSALIQLIVLIIYIVLVWRYHISGQKTGKIGFFLLAFVILFTLVGQDVIAGILAEYMLLLFTISFLQEFYHFLKYENK